MKLVHQALSAHPHSQPYPRLTRFNSHRSAAPDKAASFKSLYLNRPAEDQAAQSVRTVGGPDTALRLMRTDSSLRIRQLNFYFAIWRARNCSATEAKC